MEDDDEYDFCHNDLRQHNILVDPESLKIKAIIGLGILMVLFRWFEATFWKRPGTAPSMGDEARLRAWLVDRCERCLLRNMTLDDINDETSRTNQNYLAVYLA
jgi:hypothetical protein